MKKKVLLIVRDGWGFRAEKKKWNIFSRQPQIKNAIKMANIKNTEYLEKTYPTIYLQAAGKYVGLPEGYMGNSEVGHMTLGAGRPILQSLERINQSIERREYLRNEEILKAIQYIKKNNSTLHLIILMQDAGVHSHIKHLFETLKFCQKEGLRNEQVILHLITDGRDDNPESGIAFLAEVAEQMTKLKVGRVGSLGGRYFYMDRNQNWERTEQAFQALFYSKAEDKFSCGMDKIFSFYQLGITDEFLPPMVKDKYQGVQKNDAIFFLNFRKDRACQLSHKIEEKITEYNLYFLTMTRYYDDFSAQVVFDNLKVKNTLGEILAKNKKKQLRISETEKYAHVTFFFDGGVNREYVGKDEIMIQSPKVSSYDKQPEMSSVKLTERIILEMEAGEYDFILANFPNADMVAHTGNVSATIKAVEAVDRAVKILVEKALIKNYLVILTGDHGNAEEVAENFTSHTTNPVSCTVIAPELENNKDIFQDGVFGLGNIAPTILKFMQVEKPLEMDGDFLKK